MNVENFQPLHLKLPATSANLGPGFDAVGLALALYLTIDAVPSEEYRIEATGRNADLCGDVERSLILTTYREILGVDALPLAMILHNEIPLGMGCGSSAAALLVGVLLANHFGRLGWTGQQILEEACHREGHPDNVAACWFGGMTCSVIVDGSVITATCGLDLDWQVVEVLPATSLATSEARALLPALYSRADAVANIQSTALLVAAFSQGRGDLLQYAMRDSLHQPYRSAACPLLPALLPLVAEPGVLGVALSGAGPSVLILMDRVSEVGSLLAMIQRLSGPERVEIVKTTISSGCNEKG